MSGRSALTRAVAAVAVFAIAFAVGNALGEDEPSTAPQAPAKRAAAPLGPLRLEPAPGLPELRAVPVRPRPRPAAAASGPAAPAAPTAGADGAPADSGDYSAPAPEPPVASAPPVAAEPVTPSPPSNPPPAATDAPEPSAAPSPDPAPAPSPAPTPDPSPNGGSGQYSGP